MSREPAETAGPQPLRIYKSIGGLGVHWGIHTTVVPVGTVADIHIYIHIECLEYKRHTVVGLGMCLVWREGLGGEERVGV